MVDLRGAYGRREQGCISGILTQRPSSQGQNDQCRLDGDRESRTGRISTSESPGCGWDGFGSSAMTKARDLALLAGRIVLGGYLAAHGAQKLFGSFGGSGLDPVAGAFDQIRLRPGRTIATAA